MEIDEMKETVMDWLNGGLMSDIYDEGIFRHVQCLVKCLNCNEEHMVN
jgi:hypothetical protein